MFPSFSRRRSNNRKRASKLASEGVGLELSEEGVNDFIFAVSRSFVSFVFVFGKQKGNVCCSRLFFHFNLFFHDSRQRKDLKNAQDVCLPGQVQTRVNG